MADYLSTHSGAQVDAAVDKAHEHSNSTVLDNLKKPIIIIDSDTATIATDSTKGVSPYNTSYGYTNVTVNDLTESDLVEGTIIAFNIGAVSSTYRNVRVRFGTAGTWYPLYYTTGILAGSSYITTSAYSPFIFSKKYVTAGAFHILDHNSTYAGYSLGFGVGTCTTAASTVAKTATLASYTLAEGGIATIKFTYDVPASATLNINSKGAKPIYYKDAAITAGIIKAGDIATFQYNTHLSASGGAYELLSISRMAVNGEGLSVAAANVSGLATVATSGSYSDLSGKPSIPSGTVTSVSVKMNDATKGTVTSSGTIDLGTVVVDQTSVNANTTARHTHTNKTTLDNIPTTNPLATLSYTVVRTW